MQDSYTTPDELLREIYLAIYAALESRLHLIGSVIDALTMATVMQFECKNSQVKAWMVDAEFPACEDQTTILAELMKFYLACGNGFLIKMRNVQGQWMGLERMLPSEVQIVETMTSSASSSPTTSRSRIARRRTSPTRISST